MLYDNWTYFKTEALDYKGQLKNIKKSKTKLQPLFEALTNSIEAIKLSDNKDKRIIEIKLNFTTTNLMSNSELNEIIFIDNGIGFDDKNFERFKKLYDTSKNFNNHGSGRIQYVHFFDVIEIESIYKNKNSSTGFSKRLLKLSKAISFLKQNSIMCYQEPMEVASNDTKTKIIFRNFLMDDDKKCYESLSIDGLKKEFINHYLAYFAENRKSLPLIIITKIKHEQIIESEIIYLHDIEEEDKIEPITIYYKKLSNDGKTILESDKEETFQIKAFKIDEKILKSNSLKLTSKGEIVEGELAKKFELDILKSDDSIDNKRYLFLVSGDYINSKDDDIRGDLKIYTKKEFTNDSSLFLDDEVILLDDIQDSVNTHILKMYPEIMEHNKKYQLNITKLKEMFLLDENTLKKIKITTKDTDEIILKKVYKEDAKLIAEKDAKIKEQMDSLTELNTTSKDYTNELETKVLNLTKTIPLQNKTALTHYVARRKIVLELFQRILDNELDIQKSNGRNMDEKLLHNLIFQQSSDNPNKSDLWVINEDFIYFKGTSESKLEDIQLNGEYIFKGENELTKQEIEFKNSLGENRYAKKPDILLFPDEGKCIIIEFKNPEVNVSSHLQQIDNYASLIWNFAKEKYKFHTFYGYFIGEKINNLDVRSHDSNYIESYQFDYLFRPSKNIAGLFVQGDANIYAEVIKYSTLLKRAKKRNEIFIEKLISTSK